jgi:NADPH-dependent 2,4-dienoyl-CoA reductase/sulfur reductase-like enzyme
MELACDLLVVGAGCGGVAAALAASDLGRQVVLTESGSWLGGQLTSQAVPPDEHPWVESTGITAPIPPAARRGSHAIPADETAD